MSMSTLRPTDPSAFLCFPTDQKSAIYEIFGCFRCQKIPHPDHYFICEEKGHRICSRCASTKNSVCSSQQGEEVLASAFQPGIISSQESCCTPGTGKLRRGPPQLLNTLLKNCAWECKYKDRGCTESFLGSEWGDHVKQCRYYRIFQCHFYRCNVEAFSIRNAVHHLENIHEAYRFDGPLNILTVPFDALINSRRLLALIKWNDEYFLFSTEISDNKIFMWIWNMQVFDKDDEADIICKMKLEGATSDGKTRRKEYSNCFMAFIGTCLPYKCSAHDVIAEEDCFGMPLDWFKNHYLKADEKDTATYSVTIYLRKTNKLSGSVSSDTNKDV